MAATALIPICSAGGTGCALPYSIEATGSNFFPVARKTSNLDETLLALPPLNALSLEVTKSEGISQAVTNASSNKDGKLDVLVSDARVNYTSPVLNVDVGEGKKLFDVNFRGCLTMVQHFSRLLKSVAHGSD
jgi:1-acylglycerone phosphate reductase